MNRLHKPTLTPELQDNTAERTRARRWVVPHADIYETAQSIVLLADMPGVTQENVNITLEQDVLTLDGVNTPQARPGYTLVHGEFEACDYHRVFTLSTDVNRDGIAASVKDGVLKLVLPKVAPAKARKIAVQGL